MNENFVYSTLAGDPDLGELVDMFVEEMPDKIRTLQTQAECRDWQQLTRTAHQMKGAAGSYGFVALSPVAARLETALKAGCPEEDILRSLDELLDLCRRVRTGVPQAND